VEGDGGGVEGGGGGGGGGGGLGPKGVLEADDTVRSVRRLVKQKKNISGYLD